MCPSTMTRQCKNICLHTYCVPVLSHGTLGSIICTSAPPSPVMYWSPCACSCHMEAQAYLFTLQPCWSNKSRKCRNTCLHTFHVFGPSNNALGSHICTYAVSLVLPCSSMGMFVNQPCGSQGLYVHNCAMSQCYHMSTQAVSLYICCV